MVDNNTTNRDKQPRRPKNAPPGWRVEGGPPETSGGAGRRKPLGGPRFWWILVAALALNWFVFQIVAPNQPNRVTIPYTEFLKQVDSGNVVRISSLGDRITGNTRNDITDVDGKQHAKGFQTVRPSYVVNDDLQKRLEAKGVLDTAKSLDEPRPFWQTLLAGFGPAILLILLFVWFSGEPPVALAAAAASLAWASRAPSAMRPTISAPRSRMSRVSTRSSSSCPKWSTSSSIPRST